MYRFLGENKINLTYSIILSVLLIKVWNSLPVSPGHKMLSIIPANLHWSTSIQSRNCSVYKLSRDMLLLLVSNPMEIRSLSIPLYKKGKLTWRNITLFILVMLIFFNDQRNLKAILHYWSCFFGETVILWNGEMVKLWYT